MALKLALKSTNCHQACYHHLALVYLSDLISHATYPISHAYLYFLEMTFSHLLLVLPTYDLCLNVMSPAPYLPLYSRHFLFHETFPYASSTLSESSDSFVLCA